MVASGVAHGISSTVLGRVTNLKTHVHRKVELELDDLSPRGVLLGGAQGKEIDVGKARVDADVATVHDAEAIGGAGVGGGIDATGRRSSKIRMSWS